MIRLDRSPIPVAALMLLLALPACAASLSSKTIEGKVLEEGTNKPIPNAVVVARWQGHVGYTGTVCYHVEGAISDGNGVYHIPAWKKPSPYGDISHQEHIVTAYKPGYRLADRYPVNNPLLKPITGTREERLKVIRTASVSCGSAGQSQKNLLPLAKALYEEALGLAKTEDDKKIVNNLLFSLEIIELGYEAAEQRDIERHRGQK